MLRGEFKLFAPFKDPKLGWVCEFEAPGILDRRGKGVGVGPLDAVMYAAGHLKHLLNQMVDVATPRATALCVERRVGLLDVLGNDR